METAAGHLPRARLTAPADLLHAVLALRLMYDTRDLAERVGVPESVVYNILARLDDRDPHPLSPERQRTA